MPDLAFTLMENLGRPYFFDVLPIHPQDREHESLTGYLSRLMEANNIRSYRNLRSLIYPGGNPEHCSVVMDYPLQHWDELVRLTFCLEENLKRMTFYHLGKKFGVPDHSRARRYWLNGSATSAIRYCPQCLAEAPYHRLFWRFSSLTGCPHHHIRLLDTCGHCNARVPFSIPRHRLYKCPECGHGLMSSLSEQMPEADRAAVQRHFDDLIYLLVPQSWEWAGADTGWFIARRLTQLRRSKHLTVRQAALGIGQTESRIRLAESQTSNQMATFDSYLVYTAAMGVTIRDLFRISLPGILMLPEYGQTVQEGWIEGWKSKAARISNSDRRKMESGFDAGQSGCELALRTGLNPNVVYLYAYESGLISTWQARSEARLQHSS